MADVGVVGVTGASGKTGLAVASAYQHAGWQVRALARVGRAAPNLAALDVDDAVTWVHGDMRQRDDLVSLLDGCDAVYFIAPNMAPDEPALVATLLDAMRIAGVDRIVYHSVLHPGIEAMPHHFNKLLAESRLLTASVAATFLQPAPYLQNLVPYIERAQRGAMIAFPYGGQARLSMVDVRDVAQAAVRTTTDEHIGAAYQLCNAQQLTQKQAWDRVCNVLGLDEPYVQQSPAQWRATVGASLDAQAADWLESMFVHYDQFGLQGSALALRALLGREPTTLDSWLEQSEGTGETA